jgi:hypothetical protein
MALRSYKDTRLVPIVFVGGDPEKFERIKTHLPDAVYTEWPDIGKALNQAVSSPVIAPVPDSTVLERGGVYPGFGTLVASGPTAYLPGQRPSEF